MNRHIGLLLLVAAVCYAEEEPTVALPHVRLYEESSVGASCTGVLIGTTTVLTSSSCLLETMNDPVAEAKMKIVTANIGFEAIGQEGQDYEVLKNGYLTTYDHLTGSHDLGFVCLNVSGTTDNPTEAAGVTYEIPNAEVVIRMAKIHPTSGVDYEELTVTACPTPTDETDTSILCVEEDYPDPDDAKNLGGPVLLKDEDKVLGVIPLTYVTGKNKHIITLDESLIEAFKTVCVENRITEDAIRTVPPTSAAHRAALALPLVVLAALGLFH